jgi:hypothetical protein
VAWVAADAETICVPPLTTAALTTPLA